MALGPIDVYVIGFPGNQFTGRIAPAIIDLIKNGTIRVIDIIMVIKDADGVMTSIEMSDLGPQADPSFMSINIAQPGALGQDDADEISEDLPNNSSALLIAFENLWARKLTDALGAADAFVIDHIRIPPDVAEAVITV
jgi:hypothetical protein